MSAMEARAYALKSKLVTDRIWNLKKLFIAAIQGFCLGGGLEYAMACDLRIASQVLHQQGNGDGPGVGGAF